MRGVTILESGGATESSHTQPCPGSGERLGRRGGKGHDVHTGTTHSIVARQECDISVSHLYKWALRVVNRYVNTVGGVELCRVYQKERSTITAPLGSWWNCGSIITCASLFRGGEYPKGIWRKAIFCFCKNK
jgi:hypothetical protein